MPDKKPRDPVQTVADLQRELAQARDERDEALAQQTATVEVLQVISSSSGDLAPVFDAMLEKALRLCEASFGSLSTCDGEALQVRAVCNIPQPLAEFLAKEPPQVGPHTFLGRAILERAIIQVTDILTEEPYRKGVPLAVATFDLAGARTMLWVPLVKEDQALGVFTIYRREVRPFTDKQIALLQNFAAQAVIAMENARLITETREALEQQTATAEVLGVINASPGDLAPVFDAMLDKAMRLCGAGFGELDVYDGQRFQAAATRNVPAAYAEYRRNNPSVLRPGSFGSLVLEGQRIVHILDLEADALYHAGDPNRRAIVDLGGARTALLVPLRRDEEVLGFIILFRQEVRPFAGAQIALLQNFAAQAVIAMENARLITETREALEQQTATAEVLGVINSSPGDLAPVFEAMLEKALRLCGASFGNLLRYDGELFDVAAVVHVDRAVGEGFRRRVPFSAPPGSVLDRIVRGEDVTYAEDIRQENEYFEARPEFREMVDAGHYRSLLDVALRKEGALVGVIGIFRQEVRPFTDKQIALLQNFAAQAVIAIENARLITETREALEQQTATAEVLQVINASPGDLAPVFGAMLEKALRLCGAAHGNLTTFDGEYFHGAASRGAPPALAEFYDRLGPIRPGRGTTMARFVEGENVAHILDAAAEDAYREGAPARKAIVELGGCRTLLGVALRKEDRLLGSITVYRQEVRPFSEKQIALLQNFAAQAVIAMENARLLGELRARTDEIAGWNRELEARVATQLGEIERTGKLRRFLAPQLADLIVAQGDESILESHRREIVVVFCDLRGFTAFAERAEPEEVMALLKDYHAAMGPIVASFEGTIDHYGGDGIMVFFNDPLPTPDPARRAIEMAVAMRMAAQELLRSWRRHGHDIGFGVGISQGYATLGQIGFAERMDYTAIGTVTNLAARLCGEAKDGQILVSARVAIAVEDSARLEEIGDLSLKGLSQAVAVYNVP
jgi:GAF domain-containing protein